MAASLRGVSPELREYLRINRLPDIYEALLSGLSIMCPEDCLTFILEKLMYLKEKGLDCLHWDMFIDEDMKPHHRIVTESNLDMIFNFEDWLMPTPEMYTAAYSHYNNKLKEMCFCAMMQYHLHKKEKQLALQEKISQASQHHAHQILLVHLKIWKDWVKYRKGRQAMTFNKIQHVYNVSIGRVMFQAWYKHTLEARKQREYFERLERGENVDDDDAFGEGTGEARDSVSTLPWKIAVQIFSYLDVADIVNCACVCRFWKVLTQANLLWSRIDFYKVKKRVTDKIVTRLLYKARPYLIHLNLRMCHRLSRPSFVSVSECRNLQDLNLSECTGLDDETFKIVTKGCKILLYLNIAYTNLTDASLRVINKNCHNLQYLSLAFCNKFTDRGLLYLSIGHCHDKLQHLDISGCLQVTPQGFQYLADGCPNLQSLILNEFPTLLDECVMIVTEKCLKINTISLLGCPLLTDESLKRLAHNKSLQVLKIDGNNRISDSSMKVIGRLCPDLRHVYLADCQRLTDTTLKSLSSCKNLVVLNMADCVRISDTGIRHFTEGAAAGKLRELNLTNCVRLGDMAMVNLHKKCHNLTYLNINFCEHVSEAGIELLGQIHSLVALDVSGCNCTDQSLSALGHNARLRELIVSDNDSITDLGLQKFAQQAKYIESLDVSHCLHLTDSAIKNLAFNCRLLTSLNLSGCKHLTDLSLQYLSGVCHYIVQLDISGCIHVSDKALKYLKKGCKKMRHLNLLYCKKITKQAALKAQRYISVVQHSNEDVPLYFNY
ncbi:dynein regulatory complex subunit 6-like isoform X2 [Biomphalaria glabrata]|uniref:Dynein regulatory complex subunit 6-like isoform X2 n=1 Tax=Biomphalaria glabrata TaxID=6526 RepID=A0A9W3A6U0_BIOGL|nr:dynein regulatory complex subunit 6-like isoform X2 [Biomphalaria glabrata]